MVFFGSVLLFITSKWIITGEMEGHFTLIGWSLVRLKDLIGWPSKQRFLAFWIATNNPVGLVLSLAQISHSTVAGESPATLN